MKLTYLYRCYDREGQLLYAGITDDWAAREKQHVKEKFWWGDVARKELMGFKARREALWAEWAVITTCRPVYNKQAIPPATPETDPPMASVGTVDSGDDLRYLSFAGSIALSVRRFGHAVRWWVNGGDHPGQVAAPPQRRTGSEVRRAVTPVGVPPVPSVRHYVRAAHMAPVPLGPKPPPPTPKIPPAEPVAPPVFAAHPPQPSVDLARAKVRALELVGAAGAQGTVDGVVEKALAAEGFVVPSGTVFGWLREWVRRGFLVQTAWDTYAALQPPPPPEDPVGV